MGIETELIWNKQLLRHYLPNIPHLMNIGAGLLVRLAIQVDTVNNILWTASHGQIHPLEVDFICAGQTISGYCTMGNDQNLILPAYRKKGSWSVWIQKKGQPLNFSQAFFQLSAEATVLILDT